LGVTLAIAGMGLLFLNAIYRRGRRPLLPAFKKIVGYSLVLHYVAMSLPRVEWANAGLIGPGRAVFIYALTLACTAAGCVFFIVMGRKPVRAAFGIITEEEAADPALLKKNRKARKLRPVIVILEWVDAIASAVIIVILINIFVFQLYEVPTESMVPTFLSGDRPFTVKFLAGPRLPLTEWRLPFIKQPARGDVVTIANPRYPENSGVNLRKYLSQLVYMITFTGVNIDTLGPGGRQKSDPLVKRVVGLPGEKLMMVDDVLYVRTAADPEFRPVEADRQRYAQVDLWKLPEDLQKRVGYIGTDAGIRRMLSAWDARKNAEDPARLAAAIGEKWRGLERRVSALPMGVLSAFESDAFRQDGYIRTRRDEIMSAAPAGAENVFAMTSIAIDPLHVALAVARSPTVRAALAEFVTSGLSAPVGPTAYERGTRALSLLIKDNLISRVDLDIALISAGADYLKLSRDLRRVVLNTDAEDLADYLGRYDERNFAEFPAGDAFLGPDEYFAMGDNRYNSLDFRFSEDSRVRALDPADPVSVLYSSRLAPFPLEKRFIEGYAVFRVWPLSRMGAIR
jgi:signal peptidase I